MRRFALEPQPFAHALSIRQRWLVAERIAAGDPAVLAAAAADATEEAVEALWADPAFGRLVDACRGVQALPRREWVERAERLLRGSAERAIAEGRVSTVNLILRATGALEAYEDEAEDGEEAEALNSLAELPRDMLRGLSRRQAIEYLLLEKPGPGEEDAPFLAELAARCWPSRHRAERARSAAPPAEADAAAVPEPEPPPEPPPAGPESSSPPAAVPGLSVLRLEASRAALAAGAPDPFPFPAEEPFPGPEHPPRSPPGAAPPRMMREPVPSWLRETWGGASPYRARAP